MMLFQVMGSEFENSKIYFCDVFTLELYTNSASELPTARSNRRRNQQDRQIQKTISASGRGECAKQNARISLQTKQ